MSYGSARKMGIRRKSQMKIPISSNECVASWSAPTNAREIAIQSSSLRLFPLFILHSGDQFLVEETRSTPSRESSPSSTKCATFHLSLFWMSAVPFRHLHCAILSTLYRKPSPRGSIRISRRSGVTGVSPTGPAPPIPRVSINTISNVERSPLVGARFCQCGLRSVRHR